MSEPTTAGPAGAGTPRFHNPAPSRPAQPAPSGACDTHFHVFEPGPGLVPAAGGAYPPPAAPMQALRHMHRQLGITHGVLVQNTAVKVNFPLFVAELRSDPRLCGVATIDDQTTDAELEMLHAAKVRGCRFHFAAFLKRRPSLETFRRAIDRVAALGWHVLVHCEPENLIELAPEFAKVRIPLVVDHVSHVEIAKGLDQPAFKTLLALHRHEHVWVKVANGDRWSVTGPPTYADAVPFGRAVIENAPDRVIWGTDWPHVMYRNPRAGGDPPPDEANLLDLLHRMAPEPSLLNRILNSNPRRLYPLDS